LAVEGVAVDASVPGLSLGGFGVGRQRPVGVHAGVQDVRQGQGVARVGLLAADTGTVAVAGGGERVDRENLAVAGSQGGDEKAMAGSMATGIGVSGLSPCSARRSSNLL
jgi:hypothetical protein